ncbi:MAG: haloacid dehalogenase-like hydrolase [Acidimicrobiia bacterium]|nr:haloacid dehalogenase-like hydrolase [Acidimicrobiia bacterium]MDH5503811.1 haloacid dehalogenase-like hydrolase [Acidimicrobiia bacterium]
MPPPLYVQNVIAFVWDYDRTLIPGNQQDPIFGEYDVDPREFWAEVDGLVDYYAARGVRASRDLVYLSHMITYVENGLFPGLTRSKLAELGGRVETAPGIPEFFALTRQHVVDNPVYLKEGISVEHYVVSTGIVPMILGNKIADQIDGVWANDFIEQPAQPGYLGQLDVAAPDVPISGLGYTMDNTAKTKAIFEISKGVNKNPSINVNSRMPEEQRRVPMRHMVYIADGPSDVPVFSILNANGGKTLGVYTTEPADNFRQVKSLQEQGRIQGMAKADFRPGEAAYLWLMDSLDQIADEIVAARRAALSQIPQPPGHV